MKAFSIRSEHVDALEKMAKTLFPEYKVILYLDGYLRINDTVEIGYKEIHWFEFCTLHIPARLLTKENKGWYNFQSAKVMQNLTFHNIVTMCYGSEQVMHPVEVIYDLFKKITNEEIPTHKRANSGEEVRT